MPESRRIFLAVVITSFIGGFSGSALNLAVTAIGAEFSAGASDLSRMVSAYLFGSAMMMLPMGRLADITGRKKIYRLGAGLFVITNILAVMATSIEYLYVVRFVQGCVLAMIFGTGTAIIVSTHKPSERGKVIGYSAAATYIGLSAGPVLGGFMCHYIDWRSIFVFTAAVVMISFYLVARVKTEWFGDKNAAFDYKGSILYMIASPLLLYGLSQFEESSFAAYLLIAGVLFLGLFVRAEQKSASPLLDLHLFSNRIFALSNVAAMIHYSSTFAIGFLMSLYLQIIGLLSPPEVGMIMLLQPIVMAVLSPKAGALSDRITPGKVASAGMAINCVVLMALAALDENSPLILVGALMMVIGTGFALFSSPNNNAIMGAVEPVHYGVASSVLAAMRLFGQAISMAIVTLVMDFYGESGVALESKAELLSSFGTSFHIFALLCAFGVAASLARAKKAAK
jgi:MFS family permease